MSLFRSTVWFVKGMREYTKSGYQKAARYFDPKDLDVNCQGKVYMITGANSGIGKATAKAIASKGGTVHMVCRNSERAEEAKTEIIQETKNQNVFVHILDMSAPADVVKFAKSFAESQQGLDVLVNNAGCMVNKREKTKDGFETNFATNTLGTYLLTTQLIPVLEKSSVARVVTVSSGGMLVQKLRTEDPQLDNETFDGTMSYAQQKRQQVILTEVWADKFPKIKFFSCHPGWADTPAVRLSMPSFHEKMKDRLRSEEEGADTVIWLSISPAALKRPNGAFIQDREAVATHLPLAWTRSSPEDVEKFWKYMEDLRTRFVSPA